MIKEKQDKRMIKRISDLTKRIEEMKKENTKLKCKIAGYSSKGTTRINQDYAKKRCCGEGYPLRFRYCAICRRRLNEC